MRFSVISLSAVFSMLAATSLSAAPLAPETVAGTWNGENVIMKIATGTDGYAVDISEYTCGDTVGGIGRLSENMLSVPYKLGEKACNITITISAQAAEVSDSCAIENSTCTIEGTYEKD